MLMRWNPGNVRRRPRDTSLDTFAQLRRDMDSLFADFDRRALAPSGMPSLELIDAGEALRVMVEVPGFEDDDMHVELNRSQITIRGERETSVPEGYSVHRRERGQMSFARTITLPCRVDADQVTAHVRDGVLELTLPKAAEEQPRTIPIRLAN